MSENFGLRRITEVFRKPSEKNINQTSFEFSGITIDLAGAREITRRIFGREINFLCYSARFNTAVARAYGDEKQPHIKFSKTLPTEMAITFLQHFEENIGQGLWVAPIPSEANFASRLFTKIEGTLAKLDLPLKISRKVKDEFVQTRRIRDHYSQLEQDANFNYLNPTFKRYFELLETGLENIKQANLSQDEYEIAKSKYIGRHLRRYMELVENIIKGYYAGTLIHEVSHLKDAIEKQEKEKPEEKKIKRLAKGAVVILGPSLFSYLGIGTALLIDNAIPGNFKNTMPSELRNIYQYLSLAGAFVGMSLGLGISYGLLKITKNKELSAYLHSTENNSNVAEAENGSLFADTISINRKKFWDKCFTRTNWLDYTWNEDFT